jgi:hypothetical protein
VNLAEVGAKFDGEKVRWDLVPFDALEEVAKVYTIGARKYADRNWEKGINYSRVFGALLRHTNALYRGEEYDPENGQHHASAIAWNGMCLLAYHLRGMDNGPYDDRPRAQYYPGRDVPGAKDPGPERSVQAAERAIQNVVSDAELLGVLSAFANRGLRAAGRGDGAESPTVPARPIGSGDCTSP